MTLEERVQHWGGETDLLELCAGFSSPYGLDQTDVHHRAGCKSADDFEVGSSQDSGFRAPYFNLLICRASAVSCLPMGRISNMSKSSPGRSREISPRTSGWHLINDATWPGLAPYVLKISALMKLNRVSDITIGVMNP